MKPLVLSLIEQRTAEHPDEVFLKMTGLEVTWREFSDNVLKFGRGIHGAGIAPGGRVAIMLGNRPEFLWVYFGCFAAGAVPVPVNTAQKGETLRYLLRDSGASAAVVDEGLWERYVAARDEGRRILEIVCGDTSASAVPLAEIMSSAAEEVSLEGRATAFGILYTSGTTGPPKGVVPTRSDVAPLVAMWQAMDVHPGETLYTCLPLFHGNALALSLLGGIFLDAKVAVSERFSAARFWDEVREFEAVEFNHVGAIIPILMKQPARPADGNNPMRTCLSAGCPPHLWEGFEKRFGVRIVEQFSMVDAPGYLINHEGKVGSMGKPVAGCEAAVLDDDGNELAGGVTGELALRAAEGRTHYYLNQPEATETAYRGGWFHTGDLARRDEEGFFYYAGRKKESMRRRGENISAWEVENVVNQHPSVYDSAAHAVPSDVGEDDIKIVVVLRAAATLDPADLLDFCSERMAYYAVPRYVEFRDEIPKTPTERPRYADLKASGIGSSTWDREAAGYEVRR